MLQGTDERECVPHRREQDIATGLVGLRLNGKTNVPTLRKNIISEEVNCFAVTLESCTHVLRGIVLGAFAATPHDESLPRVQHRVRADEGLCGWRIDGHCDRLR